MTFTVALMIAVSYWGARDIQTPCHPEPTRVGNEQLALMVGASTYTAAEPDQCEILMSSEARSDEHWTPWMYCHAIVHEVGHIDGLAHSYGGVMGVDMMRDHTPWGCLHPGEWMTRHRHHGRIVLTSRSKRR